MLICRKDDELSGRKSININDINGRRVILIKRHKCPDAAMEGYMKLGLPNNSNVLLADGCEAAFAMSIVQDFPSDIFSVEVELFRGFKEELWSLL